MNYFNFVCLLTFINSKKIIYYPSCKKCIHYKPPNSYFINSVSRCNQFANKDTTTDIITYENVVLCRNDIYKCGIHGKFFEEKKINI